MKLEVGMYVRTKSGLIAKFIGYEKNKDNDEFNKYNFNGRIYWYYEYYNNYVYEEDFEEWFKESVIKVSRNITDLIEERDFVKVRIDGIFINWFMVDLFEDENENQELGIGCYEDGLLNTISEYRPLDTLEILEVLTKEQFEKMSYKVVE